MKRMLSVAAAAAAAAFGINAANAQSGGNCNSLLKKRITASGVIEEIDEDEDFGEFVLFRDRRTGCHMVVIDPMLDPQCRVGRTITATGVVSKPIGSTYELDTPIGNARCR